MAGCGQRPFIAGLIRLRLAATAPLSALRISLPLLRRLHLSLPRAQWPVAWPGDTRTAAEPQPQRQPLQEGTGCPPASASSPA